MVSSRPPEVMASRRFDANSVGEPEPCRMPATVDSPSSGCALLATSRISCGARASSRVFHSAPSALGLVMASDTVPFCGKIVTEFRYDEYHWLIATGPNEPSGEPESGGVVLQVVASLHALVVCQTCPPSGELSIWYRRRCAPMTVRP